MINLFHNLHVIQVAKIKSDEREDLKVLATGVAAALAARKVSCNINCASLCVVEHLLSFLVFSSLHGLQMKNLAWDTLN